jgi:hypothetical protein
VHVIANESVITGTVLDHDVVSSTLLGISPAMSIYRIDVRVEMSEEVEGMPSAMMYKEGGVLQLHSKKELPSNLLNKSVKARVSYAGDERGGRFWVDELERVDSAEEEK